MGAVRAVFAVLKADGFKVFLADGFVVEIRGKLYEGLKLCHTYSIADQNRVVKSELGITFTPS